MDLTTLARVKVVLEINSVDTQHDAILNQLITSVSDLIETYLKRIITSGTQTEILDIPENNQHIFRLRAWPLTSITTIHYDPDRVFGTSTLLVAADYAMLENGRLGDIHVFPSLGVYPSAIKIVYVGGLAATTAALITSFPGFVYYVEQQVAFLFNNKTYLVVTSVSSGAGSKTLDPPEDVLLPAVKNGLKRYRRWL